LLHLGVHLHGGAKPQASHDHRPVMNFDTRENVALLTVLVLCIMVPITGGLLLLFASAWLAVLHLHPHATLWGWLSVHRQGETKTVWTVNGQIVAIYYLSIVTLWLFYQSCEALNYAIRHFEKTLVK